MTARKGPRPTLFADPGFHTQHPQMAELLESAATELRQAHGPAGQADDRMAAAESYTLRANAALSEHLGADPRLLLPLVRLVVDVLAHHHPLQHAREPSTEEKQTAGPLPGPPGPDSRGAGAPPRDR
ncbi:hypothetical protein ACFV42_23710 [Streptomyces solisilvae]|uniref:hypothetical protein n=1 Tax=Streptomyces malaysiensis TaxID=92644 RepID=UPI0036950446